MDAHSLWGGGLAMRRLIRFVLGTAAAVALSLGSVAPAYADPEELPADVQAAFSSTALEHLRTAEDSLVTVDETGIPDFSSASAFGAPHQVNLWSSELIAGKQFSDPTSPLDEWLAPILGPAGELLGHHDHRHEVVG